MAQILTDLQFIVTGERQQLPPLPVEVSLALLIERPIQSFRLLPLKTPQDWAWVEFQPWRNPDPIVPVPAVDYDGEFFARYGPFVRQLARWSPRLVSPETWSQEARIALERFEAWLAGAAVLPPDTAEWLLDCLWRLWATPQGPQRELAELRERSAKVVRRRRETEAWARVERDRKRQERSSREHELCYGGDGCAP